MTETRADQGGPEPAELLPRCTPPLQDGVGSKAGEQADLLVSGQDPFLEPPSSPGDRTLWEVLRNRSEISSDGQVRSKAFPCPESEER